MADILDTLRARLDMLAALVKQAQLMQSTEDRARMERTIQLVTWALQTVVRIRLRDRDVARQKEAVEVAVLCRMIVAKAQEAGLRIADNDNF